MPWEKLEQEISKNGDSESKGKGNEGKKEKEQKKFFKIFFPKSQKSPKFLTK